MAHLVGIDVVLFARLVKEHTETLNRQVTTLMDAPTDRLTALSVTRIKHSIGHLRVLGEAYIMDGQP